MKVWLLWAACLLCIVKSRTPETAGRFYVHADTDSVSMAIVAGDSLVGIRQDGETIEYIFGNVHVTQDSTELTSNRARRMVDRQMIYFAGQVRMIDRGDSLTADTLTYDEARKVGKAKSRVRLTDGDVVAYAPEGEHFVDEKWSIFPVGVRLEDSTTTLTGESGQYWTRERRAELADNVRMLAEDIRLWADSLTHLRGPRQSTARGDVMVEQVDGPDTTRITGQWVYHDQEAKLSIVSGSPIMIQMRKDSLDVDTLIVAAEFMQLQESNEDYRQLSAGGRVRIWNREFAAIADSLAYEQADSTQSILLLDEPVLWVDESQITGDTVRVRLTDGALDSLFAFGSAFVAQLDSASGRINQAKGHRLVGAGEQDSIRTFIMGPNAEALFYNHSEENGPDGALEASGDEIILRMVNDKLRRVRFSSGVQGTEYPEESLPADLTLEGLQWKLTQRPNKEMLLSGFVWSMDRNMP